jgi:hypothetical protein
LRIGHRHRKFKSTERSIFALNHISVIRRTSEDAHRGLQQGLPNRVDQNHRQRILIWIEGIVDRLLLEVRQEQRRPAPSLDIDRIILQSNAPRRKRIELPMIVVQSHADLTEIIPALRLAGRFARLLNGGQQKCREHPDDGDRHEKLDQRKTTAQRF